ncbi:MAG TPA: MlaD family protein [Bryobacteraceae bacterium]|jgi:phospholipid/cholesterol/gamma-HCH transport system substrate-binding protein
MSSTRGIGWARFRVAAVTVAALAILSVLLLLLSGGTFFQPKATVYLYVPDATGLDPGADVRVDGIDVGSTASVGISGSTVPDRAVRVVLSVRRSHLSTITSDSTAELTADNLVGDKFVDITSGKSSTHVMAGGEIQYKASPDLMKSLDLTEFEAQLRIVDATLRDMEDGRGPVGRFVQGDKMYTDVVRRMVKLQEDLRAAVKTTGAVGSLLYTDRHYHQIEDPLLRLDSMLARIESSPWLRDTGQYQQFLDAARDLRKSVADTRAGQLFQSDDLYMDWSRRLAALVRTVDDFNAGPQFSNSLLYDNLTGMSREMGAMAHDLRENPRKYLGMNIF